MPSPTEYIPCLAIRFQSIASAIPRSVILISMKLIARPSSVASSVDKPFSQPIMIHVLSNRANAMTKFILQPSVGHWSRCTTGSRLLRLGPSDVADLPRFCQYQSALLKIGHYPSSPPSSQEKRGSPRGTMRPRNQHFPTNTRACRNEFPVLSRIKRCETSTMHCPLVTEDI